MNDSTENAQFVDNAENQSLAAAILVTAILIPLNTAPEIAEQEPASPTLIVRTHPVANAIIVRSQISPEIVVNSHPAPANFIARTDPTSSAQIVITSRPSSRIKFINDQQLLAMLRDHPAMLTKSPDGNTHLIFLNERDQHMIRKP